MFRWIRWLVILGVIAGTIAYVTPKVRAYLKERSRPKFTVEKATEGPIRWEVRTTGKVQPIKKITIGSFVSGPVVEMHADYNQWVEKDQLLAKVDPQLYEAARGQAKAALATAEAEESRAKATLQQAINDERRAKRLRDINPDYISDSEMDQFRFAKEALEAQLKVAKQSVLQAKANLENANVNLEYTNIKAPSSGIVLDRKIDSGQTIVAQFQTPELFVIAPDLDKRVWIEAAVLEADVGRVMKAQVEKRPVSFTVDAYEDDLFSGTILQVRQNPTTEQNVVTYPVIVEAANTELKLLPGMTATLSFEIDKREKATLIPGAAIRFLPDRKWVREADVAILDGVVKANVPVANPSAEDRVAANRRKRQRHVWVKDGNLLKAIPIEFGITDGKYYELTSGELAVDQEVVTGVETSG